MNKILMFLISVAVVLSANNLKVGSSISMLDKYEYLTPHDRKMKIPHKSKLIIVAYEKDTGALVNDFLNSKGKYYLQKNHSIFVADIHKMPTVITNMFALPKMKKYKHLLYLHYGRDFSHVVPAKNNSITLIEIQDRKVTKISFTKNIKDIQAAIEK